MITNSKEKCIMNWSGGKDSAMALHYLLQENNLIIESFITTVNSKYQRISMHGIQKDMLVKQVEKIGFPLKIIYLPEEISMDEYDNLMTENLQNFKNSGVENSVFGDIFLEDLKNYRVEQLSKLNIKGVFPLWKKNTTELIREFLDLGFKTRVCSINKSLLSSDFLGVDIDDYFLKNLPQNIDCCGENGEFHTFIYDGPIFKEKFKIKNGKKIIQSYFHEGKSYDYEFCDIIEDE